jgi:hypothetical protein
MNEEQKNAIFIALRVLRRELQHAEDAEGYITGTADIEMIYDKLKEAFPNCKPTK